jgi:hypothetical protein
LNLDTDWGTIDLLGELPNILQLEAIQRLQKQQPGLFDPPD